MELLSNYFGRFLLRLETSLVGEGISQHMGPTWLWDPHNMKGIIYIWYVKVIIDLIGPSKKLIGIERRRGKQIPHNMWVPHGYGLRTIWEG